MAVNFNRTVGTTTKFHHNHSTTEETMIKKDAAIENNNPKSRFINGITGNFKKYTLRSLQDINILCNLEHVTRYSFWFLAYLSTEEGILCSEIGRTTVDDFELCRDAANQLSYQFKGTDSSDNFPKGCYETGSEAYFNEKDGSKNPAATQICIHAGKGLRSFYASIAKIFLYALKCFYACDLNLFNLNSRSVYRTSIWTQF